MRILIVAHGYPPTHLGGAEQRAARTARALLARGHDVAVLCVESCSGPERSSADKFQDGILVRRVWFSLGSTPDPFRWSYDNPHFEQALTGLIQSWQPEVLHLFSGYLTGGSTSRVARTHGLPLVVSLTDYWWLCHRINLVRSDGSRCDGPSTRDCTRCAAEIQRRFREPARRWPAAAANAWRVAESIPMLRNFLDFDAQKKRADELMNALNHADALIAPSAYLAKTYMAYGADASRIHVLRQGVDLNACLLPKPSTTLRFAYMGQVKSHKGVDLLLEAWGRLSGTRARSLTLWGSDAGEPSYGARLREYVRRLAGVNWAGQFSGAAVWPVLAETDVLVVPSRWVENSPNAILEAQAVGVPVVGSAIGGVGELIQHERNGLVFRVDDASDLRKQLQRLLDEPELLRKLKTTQVPFKSIDQATQEIIEIYSTAISRRALEHKSPPRPRSGSPLGARRAAGAAA